MINTRRPLPAQTRRKIILTTTVVLAHPDPLDDVDAGWLAQLPQDINPTKARRQVANLRGTLHETRPPQTVTTRATANRIYLGKTQKPPPKRADSDAATTGAHGDR